METKTETYQEALDFVKEMLNATEPNVMNHLAANRIIDHQLRDLVNRATKVKPEYWSDSVEADGQIIFDHWNCPNCHHEFELDYETLSEKTRFFKAEMNAPFFTCIR